MRKTKKKLNAKIFFCSRTQGREIYITAKGIVQKYLVNKYTSENLDNESKKEQNENEENLKEESRKSETKPYYVKSYFQNSNKEVLLNGLNLSDFKHNYSLPDKNITIQAGSYEKVILKNIYSGVDIEFSIPEEGGIKYTLFVKAGTDVSLIKIKHAEIKNIEHSGDGSLRYILFNDLALLEAAPNVFYAGGKEKIFTQYKVDKNTESFSISNYDKSKDIVIDPWLTNPNFTGWNNAYDVAKDNNGNVFIYGGPVPYTLNKYNSSGILQWTFTTPYASELYGDFAVDQIGNVIMTEGFRGGHIVKINPSGAVIYNVTQLFGAYTEFWRIAYNCDYSVVRMSGYILGPDLLLHQMADIDPNTGTIISTSGAVSNESRAICIDPQGNIYSITPTQGCSSNPASNYITKFNPNLTLNFITTSGYNMNECQGGYINSNFPPYGNSFEDMNGIIADNVNVYTWDGHTIYKRRNSNGSLVNSLVINSGATLLNSGIIIDACNNLYIGTQTSILQLDSNLVILDSIPTPGAVYDICFSISNNLIACGAGYVSEFNFNTGCNLSLSATATNDSGCGGTPNGTASIVVTPLPGDTPPYTYLWSNGATTQTITGLSAGTYYVNVKESSCNSKTGIDSVKIISFPKPAASFTFTNKCNGTAIPFNSTSSISTPGIITGWNWDFGDNTIGTGSSTSHTYSSPGNYNATLIINSNNSCADTITRQITVFNNPVAAFTHNDVCLKDSLHFANNSAVSLPATVSGYLWSFGDSSATSNLKNPSHFYSNQGTYSVTLVCTTADGCTNAVTNTVSAFDPPHSAFTFTNSCLADSALFTNTSTNPTMGSTAGWSWNFGDSSPLITSAWNPRHLYALPGNYPVNLITHSSNLGCPDTFQTTITIFPMPVAKFYFTNVCLNQPIHFNDSSTVSSGNIAVWSWNFGDATPMNTFQNPSHNYTNPGKDTVSLIVTTNNGCKDTVTKKVMIHPLPTVQFSRTNVCVGNNVLFNDLSSIPPSDTLQSWIWNFADGSPNSGISSPSHLYAAAGSYSVQLKVQSKFGCMDSTTKISIINPNPIVNFTATNRTGCEPLCMTFNDSSSISTGINQHWLWNFGDGSPTNSSSSDLLHCYTNDSAYSAMFFSPVLKVTSDSGCVSTKSKNNYITVYPRSKASFMVQPQTTVIIDPVISIIDLSTGANFWNWNFGDHDTTSKRNPAPHTYADTGSYLVTLITSTLHSCKDTTYQSITIEPNFLFYIPNSFSPNDDGINDTFTGKGIFIKEFGMTIYDRWGNLIFFSDDVNKPWDGKANHGTEIAQQDIYIYTFAITDYNKKKHNYKGIVTLVR